MSGKGEKDNAKHKRESAPTNVYAQLLADEQSIQPVVSKLSEHDFDFEPATRSSSANSQVIATFPVLILCKRLLFRTKLSIHVCRVLLAHRHTISPSILSVSSRRVSSLRVLVAFLLRHMRVSLSMMTTCRRNPRLIRHCRNHAVNEHLARFQDKCWPPTTWHRSPRLIRHRRNHAAHEHLARFQDKCRPTTTVSYCLFDSMCAFVIAIHSRTSANLY
jgi:hypothetical protein